MFHGDGLSLLFKGLFKVDRCHPPLILDLLAPTMINCCEDLFAKRFYRKHAPTYLNKILQICCGSEAVNCLKFSEKCGVSTSAGVCQHYTQKTYLELCNPSVDEEI